MNFRATKHRWVRAWIAAAALAAASASAGEDQRAATPLAATQAVDGAAADVPPAPTAAEIAGWIDELDDNRYLVREQATQRLLAAGVPALDGLLAAANGNRPERADRALWVLRRLGSSGELSPRRQALERLVRIEHRPQLVSAARQALAVIEHQEAVAAIEKLGGRFHSPQFGESEAMTAPFTTVLVILDSNWRGGDAGLAHLRDLLGLRRVIIVGTDVSPSGLGELKSVKLLEDLWLFGTKLKPEDVPNVQALLPNVKLDYRRGGFLGVGANTIDGAGPAIVNRVQADSAAAAAGMKVGDLIQTFNGQPITTFKELTTKIGDCGPGEEIKLEVLRGGKPLSLTIKLGEWQTI